MSAGEYDLQTLLSHMDPVLDDQEYVYATGPEPLTQAIFTFRESEGVSLILRRADAESLGIPFTYPCRRITLTIHSSLEAVGLFAAITTRLAAHGISVNAVSGYYHDHLFVRTADAPRAMALLEELRTERRNRP
jgi:hypothetical protein